ncbi:MAG: RluA family pseudouridine synthase [Chthonomonas sp.]|nr:RluA family pseudouridine synthase [Chthonomonas sp.]
MEFRVESPTRLDKFLAEQLQGFSRTKLVVLIEHEGVWVDGILRKPSFRVEPGMVVSLDEVEATPAHDLTPVPMDLDVVFEDSSFIVINKPRGLASHPAPGLREPTLVNGLLARWGSLSAGSAEYRPGIVHRLDKETTGLMVVAKTDAAHRHLAAQIAEKSAERRYVGLAQGVLGHSRLKIEAPIGRDRQDRRKMAVDPHGKPAVTHVKVLQESGGDSLIAARLETGRTHQIRVHLSASGHPLKGDTIYAKAPWSDGPLQLHAAYLGFKHPETETAVAFFALPPPDFEFEVSRQLVENW